MPSKARTLMCVSPYRANIGFAWAYIEGIYARVATELAKEGFRTVVAYPVIPSPPVALEGTPATGLVLPVSPFSYRVLTGLFRTLRRENVRAVYFTDWYVRHWTYILFRLAGVRLILMHDHTSGERSAPRGLRRLSKWILARVPWINVDEVVGVSEFVARRVEATTLTPRNRLHVVRNAIPMRSAGSSRERDRAGVPATNPIIFCACRAIADKGVDHLLRAFELLRVESIPESERPVLVYAGSGPQMTELEQIRDSLSCRDRVRFLGYRTDVPALMREAAICVMPSVWQDAFPLAVLEPMAMGKAVIGTAVGGIPEIIYSAQVGLLVPPADSPALAAAMQELLDKPGLRDEMGAAAKKSAAERFREEDQIRALVDLLRPGLAD